MDFEKQIYLAPLYLNQVVVILLLVDYHVLVDQGGLNTLYDGSRYNMEYCNFYLNTHGQQLSPSGWDY